MQITKEVVTEHAATFAQVLQLLADVANFRGRTPEIIVAGVRAVLGNLSDLLEPNTKVTPAQVDKRIADLRHTFDLADAHHDSQLNLKFNEDVT